MAKLFYWHSDRRAMSRVVDWSRLYAAWLPRRVVAAVRGCRVFHHGLLAIGHQLIEPAVRPSDAELGEDVAEIGVGLEAVQLRRGDDRVEDRGPLGAGVGAGEEPVVAADGDAAEGTLDGASVELELPVEEDGAERSALALEVGDRLAEGALGLVAAVVLSCLASQVSSSRGAAFDCRRDDGRGYREWVHPTDPEAKIMKVKDGSTHLAHKHEQVLDLETG